MKDQSSIQLSIELKSLDGTPLQLGSITINNQEFVPKSAIPNNELPQKDSEAQHSDQVKIASVILPSTSLDLSEPEKQVLSANPFAVVDQVDSNRLEEFGGDSFYRPFWGKLTYKMLSSDRSLVTYQGGEDVFTAEFVGKWLEPSRVHRCSPEFPHKGRNYFPGALAVVYSRVVEVIDGKNLIVDFGYNGGSKEGIALNLADQDGIFFFDNKLALQSWSQSAFRKQALIANSGQIYACLGFPNLEVKEGNSLIFKWSGAGVRPAIHVMLSDGFTGDQHGTGETMPDSFKETFGESLKFFDLPGSGRVDIDFDWQLIPPTYSQKVVQYGSPHGVIFFDGAPLSTQYGLKRFANFDQHRIKNQMEASLGFVRPGVTFSMPNQGYCNGGGIHDGHDITEFCTYRFEGDWFSKDPNNMKARTSGGLRLEWIGHSDDRPGRFIELESQKASLFEQLKFRFLANNELEVDSDDFTWYHLACQEWTGGISTNSEFTFIEVEGARIPLSSNGDFWLVYGDGNLNARSFHPKKVKLFDRIPSVGDVIRRDAQNPENCSLIGKISDNQFEIWGWAIQTGDQLSFNSEIYTVQSTSRKWKTWDLLAHAIFKAIPRINRNDRKINYTEITLDRPISSPVESVEFTFVKSKLQGLLDGKSREGCKAGWGFGNDSPGHLMYIDYNVNLILKNVEIRGLIRSTSRPLWAETTKPHSGYIQALSVGQLGSEIWKKGDKLYLAHPESGKLQQVELEENFNGFRGELKILPIELKEEFPQNSVVVGLFALATEARFEQVKFVNEDLTPCFSERIDYRPQGLRLRQLLTKDNSKRVVIKGGRISWYSTVENRFEPEVDFSDQPLLVNTRSVVPVLLNPIVSDGKGIILGFQQKESGKREFFTAYRVIVSNSKVIDLSGSILGADLYLEGNGEFILDRVTSKKFTENGRDLGFGFSLIVQDKYVETKLLILRGNGGKVGLLINSPYPSEVLKVNFQNWHLLPALFNDGGFHTFQNQNDPGFREAIQISN